MLKYDLMVLANVPAEKVKQQRKAEVYSARCRMKRRNNKIHAVIRNICIFCGFVVFFLIWGIIDTLYCEAKESNTRTAEAVLVGFDTETGDAILQTEDGHQWKISDPPEVWYTIAFNTKGTVSVEDDEIIGLEEYNGDAEKAVEAVK